VILTSSFQTAALHEVRLQANDVANEERIRRQSISGPLPEVKDEQWAARRRDAWKDGHKTRGAIQLGGGLAIAGVMVVAAW
jgi:hypothetical protein